MILHFASQGVRGCSEEDLDACMAFAQAAFVVRNAASLVARIMRSAAVPASIVTCPGLACLINTEKKKGGRPSHDETLMLGRLNPTRRAF